MAREYKDEAARSERLQAEYEDLLKSAARDAAVKDAQIEQLRAQLQTENDILRFEIEQLKRYVLARSAERDFAEKQLGRIRRALA
jgi:hypothetical protein